MAKEWVSGLTADDLGYFAEKGRLVHLGSIYSESPLADANKDRIKQTLDGLLQLFDIDTESWQEHIVSGKGTFATVIGTVGNSQYEKRDLQRWARNQRLGEFILERAYLAVPLESGDDEDGEFELTLQLSNEIRSTIRGVGAQEVYRSYHDKVTGARLTGPID